jgi:hypothetical protein
MKFSFHVDHPCSPRKGLVRKPLARRKSNSRAFDARLLSLVEELISLCDVESSALGREQRHFEHLTKRRNLDELHFFAHDQR